MKKKFYLFIGLMLSLTLSVISQNTSFDTSFEAGQPTGNWYSWGGAFTTSFNDGEMVVDYNKSDDGGGPLWDRLIIWVKPFDFIDNPFISFTIKSDASRDAILTVKDDNDIELNLAFSLVDDGQFHTIFFNLTDNSSAIDLSIVNELQFDIGFAEMSGTLIFDNFKLGEAAAPAIKRPTINPVDDLIVQINSGEQIVNLSGISDGDGTTEPISIAASTDNTELIADLSVEYFSPGTTGILKITPAPDMQGDAKITIIVTDAGEMLNTTQISFEVKVRESGNTGFAYFFDKAQLPDGIESSPQFSTSLEDEALKVIVNKSNRWGGYYWELGNTYDISENPYLNLSVRSNMEQILQVFLVDIFGNGYRTELLTTQFAFHELVANKNEFRQNRIYPGEDYVDVTFDFSDADPSIIDLTNIVGIQFVSNGTALSLRGTYFINTILMGDLAVKKAYVGQLAKQSFNVNSTGKQKILVPEIKNTVEIELQGAENLIENISVEDITYINKTENGKPIVYGYTNIEFDLIEGAVGTEQVTLIAKGDENYANYEMSFSLTISENNPPEIDTPEDVVVQTGVQQSILLSGINDGDPDIEQTLTISAQSSNLGVISEVEVDYDSTGKYGKLLLTALSPGEASVEVTVTDDENAATKVTFNVIAYNELNNIPTINFVDDISVMNDGTQKIVQLSGIHDGDSGSQQLTISAVSSNPEVIADPTISYQQGEENAKLLFVPQANKTGDTQITITVSDDGGNSENDGDKSTVINFQIRVMATPLTGFEFDLNDPEILTLFKPEDAGTVFKLAIVDTLGSKALRIKMKDKWTFGGIWTDIPEVLDLSEFPIISYDVLSLDNPTWHWNYFYEMYGTDSGVNRNTENSEDKQYTVPANEWKTVSFDYRYPGDLNNDQGNPIDAGKINAVLFNIHNSKPGWPFTDYTGTVYYRNIRLGDIAEFGEIMSTTTMDMLPEQSAYLEDGIKYIQLTGISNGKGSIEGVTVSATTTQPNIIPVPKISSIQNDGTALLSYKPEQIGSSNIRVTVEAEGAEPLTVSMLVRVVSKEQNEVSVLNINRSEKRQTIVGLGTFQNERRWSEMYAKDLGASAMRIGIIDNQWEPVNDNNNSDVINMDGFNYNAFDWDYFRELKEMGVETFILTSWSPPAWMKRNLSLDHREQAISWENTDNILEPYFYEEFAESMVALVKAFKEESGIDIKAIGLQNEPYFNEPYASAILSGTQFGKLIEVVGNRFASEGMSYVDFYMPEQVFGSQWGSYSNEGYLTTLRQNSVADSYTKYFAVHGYDGTGITAGFPSYSNWESLYNLAQQGDYPKELWMTETHIEYKGWTSALQLAGAIHGSLWAGNISLWTNWSFGDMQLTNNVPNSSFYTSKNYFKYIRPGAVRVETSSDHPDILATAFENPDGRFTVVLINKGNAPVSLKLEGEDLPPVFSGFRTSRYENFVKIKSDIEQGDMFLLPPSSVTTLVTDNIFMDAVNDITVSENSGQSIINISKITNDIGTTDGLTLSYHHTNPELFSQISLSEISANGTALIHFTPTEDKVGFSEITLILTDEDGAEREVSFFINVVEVPVSTKPLLSESVEIYPNPAKSYIIVKMDNEKYDRITLFEINGRKIIDTQIHSNNQKIDLYGLQQGIYFVKVSGEDGSIVKKIVINH